MGSHRKETPDWREFEKLVARIEADAGPRGLVVKSPDRIRSTITGRLREVDASIRAKIGTSDVLITIECRKRNPKQDITWIEQLATKKQALGAARTIAVSSSGFSPEAEAASRLYGIDLRQLSDLSVADINALMRLDFVLFTHKRCALARVAVRFFRGGDWSIPDPENIDYVVPVDTDVFSPLFKNTQTDATWSLNDLWLQLQEATDPFSEIPRNGVPLVKTACFPYLGNVTIETPNGPKQLGDVLLSVALSLEVEQVSLDAAKKVEYRDLDGDALQRIEFQSTEPGAEDYRVSLQMPKDCPNIGQLRTRATWPEGTKGRN